MMKQKQKIYKGNEYDNKVNRIKTLYENMLMLDSSDVDYANKLAFELCRLQKEDGSWKVYEGRRIESDCMIEYGYVPTYYATAALIHLMKFDDSFKYDLQLKNGINYITFDGRSKQFVGHGFDAERDQLKALNIFKNAGLYEWLIKYGNEYNYLATLIKSTIDRYRKALNTGCTYGGFAENFKEQYIKEVEEYEMATSKYVWYVAYGSNINNNRFNEYLANCNDTTPYQDLIKYVVPHDIYFAYSSRRWGNKGVAFLDDSKPGKTYGCAYKIKIEQFYEIMRLEGAIYNKKVSLGLIDDIPVYTFTSNKRRTDIKEPSSDYINVIIKGLMETYSDKCSLALENYFYGKYIFDDVDKNILRYIKNSEHGISVENISNGVTNCGIVKAKKKVKLLESYGFIKQDSRNARLGHRIDSGEAVVYTNKGKRDLIDFITL